MPGSFPDLPPGAARLGHCSCCLGTGGRGGAGQRQERDGRCLMLLLGKAERNPWPLYEGAGVPCLLWIGLALSGKLYGHSRQYSANGDSKGQGDLLSWLQKEEQGDHSPQ